MKITDVYHAMKFVLDPRNEYLAYGVNVRYTKHEPTVIDMVPVQPRSVTIRVLLQGGISLNGVELEDFPDLYIATHNGDFVLYGKKYGAMNVGGHKIVAVHIA